MVIEEMSSEFGRLMLTLISYLAPLETCLMSAETMEQSRQEFINNFAVLLTRRAAAVARNLLDIS